MNRTVGVLVESALAPLMVLGLSSGLALALAGGMVLVTASCTAPASPTPSDTLESAAVSDAGPDGNADAAEPVAVDGGAADGSSEAGASTFTDPRDGKTYPTVKLGANTWLGRNLDYAIAGSSFCYGNVASNCASDGRLYLFSAAKVACPPAWHLGSDEEWKSLESALGMGAEDLDLEGYEVSRGTSEGTIFKAGTRMAGYRTGTTYDALGDRTYFWTSTTRGSEVWRRRVAASEPTIFRVTNPPDTFAISVRCVAD
jgi:uncharacterized protein (TIGR02145 family)